MPGNGKRSGGAKARKGGGGGGQAPLPAGVTKDVMPDLTHYSFYVGGEKVVFEVAQISDKGSRVAFEVGGSYDRGWLDGREADIAALKIMRIFRHEVSTRPEGYMYTTSAWTQDGYGSRRAKAYELAGFGAPRGGEVGHDQYGVVKNGKLTPYEL